MYIYEYIDTGVGMQAGIPRNQLSSIIRTNGCTIKADTNSFARSSKTKGGVRLSNVKRSLSKVKTLIIRSRVK